MCQRQQQEAASGGEEAMPEAEVTAGIPVSSELATATGQRLLDCLLADPQLFVALAAAELWQVPPALTQHV